ncbi:MAG: hypothetical protein J2P32_10420 [Actinobacteria bacterium]|nr:hypothetical protein [Actinomycetota bacterium]
MTTPETAGGEQTTVLTCLADELGGRNDGWALSLAPARRRPVLEVVNLATRRCNRIVTEAGSLWWWPQVIEIGPASDLTWAATRVAAVLGVPSSLASEAER